MFFVHFCLTERSASNRSFTSDVDVLSASVSSARRDSADERNESMNTGG